MFEEINIKYKEKILNRFKEDFDEAQQDEDDIEYATDQVIDFYFINYPSLREYFVEYMETQLAWYRDSETAFEE